MIAIYEEGGYPSFVFNEKLQEYEIDGSHPLDFTYYEPEALRKSPSPKITVRIGELTDEMTKTLLDVG